ncbi:MAG: TlpA disulfide reductase family protein [Pyrinomonadaceae bacterium]
MISASCFLLACTPAAAPVAVSNEPASINDRPTTNMPSQPSKPLAEMSWTDADDRVHKLSDLKGKAVILDFWATYCEPCKREIPHLNSLLAQYGADNLHVVGLNVGGEEDAPKIPDFVKATKMDYGLAFPEDDLTRYIFAERSDIPQTLVIDRNGNIVKKIIGFSPVIQKELDAAVELATKQN